MVSASSLGLIMPPAQYAGKMQGNAFGTVNAFVSKFKQWFSGHGT
jgi:hypothetical protein